MKRTALSLAIVLALFSFEHRVSSAAVISVSQTIEFPEVLPFTEGTFVLGGWDNPFPFTTVGEISTITFEFSSTDPDYAVAPLGGVSHVEIGVMSEDPIPVRTALSSVNPGFPSVIVHQGLPVLFPFVESLILDGDMTASLIAFQTITNGTGGLNLDEPSFLTLTVEGTLIPEPSALVLLGIGTAGLIGSRRRRSRVAA